MSVKKIDLKPCDQVQDGTGNKTWRMRPEQVEN